MLSTETLRRLSSTVSARFIDLFPALLAAGALLIVGFLVSWLVSALVGRLLRQMGLDQRLAASGMDGSLNRAGIRKPVSTIMARLVFWLIFACFTVLALENLGLDVSDLPIRAFIAYVPQVIGAAIILIVGVLLATFLGQVVEASLTGMGVTHERRLGAIVRNLLIAIVLIVTVDHLGFDVTLLVNLFTVLMAIVVAGLVLAFSWGGRDVARSVLAGYYVRENFRLGDRLVVDGHAGRLEEIGTISARLATESGSVMVPNSRLVEASVEVRQG
jgi:hypothetical protein